MDFVTKKSKFEKLMDSTEKIHIIAFDVPFPANYGGVIDVYYKIKYLSEAGVNVHLHCFEYGRKHSEELATLCEQVHYYPRKTGLQSHFSLTPYIVKSRTSEALVKRLLEDDYPILFEGMHTMAVGLDPRLKHRFKIYRESNIEHHYYYHLFKAEKSKLKRWFFKLESLKLEVFEKHILAFDKTLVVSEADKDYLQQRYPETKIDYLPSYHPNNTISSKEGKGNYALYNGNLSVVENIQAVEYLVQEVFSEIDYPLIVSGLNPSADLERFISKYENVSIEANVSNERMFDLVQNAQFNILTTEQATGLKLKLLNTLFQGRFCIVNDKMTKGTGLDELCIIANTSEEIRAQIAKLKDVKFGPEAIDERKAHLFKRYSNANNIQQLMGYCFPEAKKKTALSGKLS